MIRQVKRILTVLTVLSLLMMPAVLNVEAVATTDVRTFAQKGCLYIIQNVHSGKFLEVADGNLVSGANVWQDTFNYDSTLSQMFYLFPADTNDLPRNSNGNLISLDDTYFQVLPAMNLDLCLTVHNASNTTGANIKVASESSGSGSQSFAFISNNDGSYRIQPVLARNSHRVLTVEDASTSNKANVELSTWNEDTSQKWVLKELYPGKDAEVIDLNWSYFFRGDAGSTYRRITQRMHLQGSNTENWHVGTDFPTNGNAGIPFYSPCSGTVLDSNRRTSMGYYVIIKTSDTILTNDGTKHLTIRLMHMNEPALVETGDTVTKNTQIGYVGYLGTGSTGYHLHVDVNSGDHKWGEEIRGDKASLINVEKMFLSKRFRYGGIDDYIYATGDIY